MIDFFQIGSSHFCVVRENLTGLRENEKRKIRSAVENFNYKMKSVYMALMVRRIIEAKGQ